MHRCFPKAAPTLAGLPGKAMQEPKRAAPAKAAEKKPAQVKGGETAQATKATSQAKRGSSSQAKKGTGKR